MNNKNSIKMTIVFDEEKVEEDGRYNTDELYDVIRAMIKEQQLNEIEEKNQGISFENKRDFYEDSWRFGVILLKIEKNLKLTTLMKKWVWDISENEREDVLEILNKERIEKKERVYG